MASSCFIVLILWSYFMKISNLIMKINHHLLSMILVITKPISMYEAYWTQIKLFSVSAVASQSFHFHVVRAFSFENPNLQPPFQSTVFFACTKEMSDSLLEKTHFDDKWMFYLTASFCRNTALSSLPTVAISFARWILWCVIFGLWFIWLQFGYTLSFLRRSLPLMCVIFVSLLNIFDAFLPPFVAISFHVKLSPLLSLL